MKIKRAKFKLFFLVFFPLLGFYSSFCFVEKAEAKTITIDGTFNDWTGAEKTITDSLSSYPFSGTTYYFNLASGSWQTNDPGTDTCMANYDQMTDIGDVTLTNDNNYLYFKVRRGSDFTSYFWQKSETTVWGTFSGSAASSYNSNPCAGKVIETPADFNRSLVFSFDKNDDETADYYLVFNFSFEEGTAPEEGLGKLDEDFYTHSAYLFQDDGDGVYENSVDDRLASLGSGDYDVSTTLDSAEGGILQEMKVDLTGIMEEFGLSFGDSVLMKGEISDGDVAEETGYSSYSLSQDNLIRLTVHTLNKTKKTRVRVAGRSAKNSSVSVFVDGANQGNVKVSRKGKFSKWVSLSIGDNRVRIASQNESGTKSIIRNVEREALRAIDKPLGLGIIHSKNKTAKTTLQIWGKAHGVSRVQILVDEVEWGWAVVNTKTGKYDAKIRLSEGLNTLKVVAAKDDETVIVTKIVNKT